MFEFIPRFFKRRFGVDKEYFRFIDEMFGFVPHNIELYKVALIHKSASQSIGGHSINNERLEYLGDAIIESITSDYLFIEFPDGNEGFLTQMRSKLVSRQSLNEIARKIGLDRYVIYNMSGNFAHKHIYGDAFEAMIGAIYLDKGYEFVNRLLIGKIYAKYMDLTELTESECDFKSRLIEWCQKNHHKVAFRTRTVNSRRSAPIFYTTVLIDGIEVGHGSGDSKKAAEQSASGSVSHQMSDEECADLLDKFDDLHNKIAGKNGSGDTTAETDRPQSENGEHSRSSRSRRRRRKRSAAENTENSGMQHDNAIAEPAVETVEASNEIPDKQPNTEEEKKTRRSSRRRKNADAGDTTNATAPIEQAVEEVVTEKKSPRRKRSSKSSETNTAETAATEQPSSAKEVKEDTISEPETETPAKPRRKARQKTETEQLQHASTAIAEEQPRSATRKRRSTKNPTLDKSENTAEVKTGDVVNAEMTGETPNSEQMAVQSEQSEKKRPTRRRTRKVSTDKDHAAQGAAENAAESVAENRASAEEKVTA